VITPEPGVVQGPVSRVTGLQLNTVVNANATVDILAGGGNHGLLVGAALTELAPVGAPSNATAVLRDNATGLQANLRYVSRWIRPSWGAAIGGGVSFGFNGRIGTADDGSLAGLSGSLPGQGVGPFVMNGQTTSAILRANLQLTHPTWDLDLQTIYNYTANGLYTLASGAPAATATPGSTSALGAFVPLTAHTLFPSLRYRLRVSPEDLFSLDWSGSLIFPATTTDPITVTHGTATGSIAAPAVMPRSAVSTLSLGYSFLLTTYRSIGFEVGATGSVRAPTTLTGPEYDAADREVGFRPDALIGRAAVRYSDSFGKLRAIATAGAAKAALFQAPLGASDATMLPTTASGLPLFDTTGYPVTSKVEPIGSLTLIRRFDPVDVTLFAARSLSPGGLGASAVVSEAASLSFRYILRIPELLPITTSLGISAARVRGASGDKAVPSTTTSLMAVIDNDSAGATLALAMPVYKTGDVSLLSNFVYSFVYSNIDPLQVQIRPDDPSRRGLDPMHTHTVLFTLTALVGRGTLQSAGSGTIDPRTTPDLFSRDPRTGSALATSALIQGAPILDGTRNAAPGLPIETRVDTEEAYEESNRQQRIENESKQRAAIVGQSQSIESEDAARVEEEEKARETRRAARSRSFGDWVLDPRKVSPEVLKTLTSTAATP
jgi:hypothetical protein